MTIASSKYESVDMTTSSRIEVDIEHSTWKTGDFGHIGCFGEYFSLSTWMSGRLKIHPEKLGHNNCLSFILGEIEPFQISKEITKDFILDVGEYFIDGDLVIAAGVY